jgi:hypothetical protein
MLDSKVIYTCMMIYVALIAGSLVGCDAKYTVDYAQKKYETAVSEGKAYADSLKAHEDSTVYRLTLRKSTYTFCMYENVFGDTITINRVRNHTSYPCSVTITK